MPLDGGVILLALAIRLVISVGIGYLAEELGHAGLLWGALSFFLLGLWTLLVLLLWTLIQDNNGL